MSLEYRIYFLMHGIISQLIIQYKVLRDNIQEQKYFHAKLTEDIVMELTEASNPNNTNTKV